MKRFVWIMTTACTLTCTGFVLANAGWFQTSSPSGCQATSIDSARDEDICSSEAAWRWGHCQPTHWRALILQRP